MNERKDPVEIMDQDYRRIGADAQRRYPCEALVRFVASRLKHPSKVLDIGCGNGTHMRMLATEGHEAHGIDASPTDVEMCPPNAVLGRFTELPFSEQTFDAAIETYSFQHLDIGETRSALGEVHRILKPGGFFFSYRLGAKNSSWIDLRHQAIDEITLLDVPEPYPLAGNGTSSFWDESVAGRLLSEAQLRTVEVESYLRTYASGLKVEYLSVTAQKPPGAPSVPG